MQANSYWSRFHEALRLTKAGLSDQWIQKMHALVRKSSFSKAQGLRETGSWTDSGETCSNFDCDLAAFV